jgi:hypothetical protein
MSSGRVNAAERYSIDSESGRNGDIWIDPPQLVKGLLTTRRDAGFTG